MTSCSTTVSAGTLLYDFLIGETIDDKYFLEEFIAEDSFGAVYNATLLLHHKPIAKRLIKLMPVHLYSGCNNWQLKDLEMGLLYKHRNLVNYNTVGKYSLVLYNDSYDFYFADMSLTDYSLLTHFDANQALSSDEILHIISDVADALEFLHRQGLTHGHLQPENIHWSEEEQVWKVAHVGLEDDPSGMLVYLPPEAFNSCNELSEAADIWALGILTYLLLMGEVPYAETTEAGVINAICQGQLTLAQNFPACFEALIQGCLAKDVDSRWTAHQVLAELKMSLPLHFNLVPH